jgi:hypothetical protein
MFLRLRRALLLLFAVSAFAPTLLAGNFGSNHPGSKSNLSGHHVPATAHLTLKPGDKVTLNPQPLPPKMLSTTSSLGDKVSLNPQPLPPRVGNAQFFGR